LRSEMQKIGLEWPAYGYRRVHRELIRRGWVVNHKRVLRLMRMHNLLCVRRRKFIFTTDSKHGLPIYPNLAKDMVTGRRLPDFAVIDALDAFLNLTSSAIPELAIWHVPNLLCFAMVRN
jgi:transposase InsO family protein